MKIWRSSLICLEFVFCRVCSLVKTNLSIHDWFFWVVGRIYEYLYHDLLFWLIRAISWNHLGLANPPLRPWAPLDEVAIVGGGVRCGCSWVSCCVSPRDEEEEMSKGSIKQTRIPHCVHGFLLDILGHYGIQTIWKITLYMLNGFVSRRIAYFFPQGSSPIEI